MAVLDEPSTITPYHLGSLRAADAKIVTCYRQIPFPLSSPQKGVQRRGHPDLSPLQLETLKGVKSTL